MTTTYPTRTVQRTCKMCKTGVVNCVISDAWETMGGHNEFLLEMATCYRCWNFWNKTSKIKEVVKKQSAVLMTREPKDKAIAIIKDRCAKFAMEISVYYKATRPVPYQPLVDAIMEQPRKCLIFLREYGEGAAAGFKSRDIHRAQNQQPSQPPESETI
jgi:hypothetical protein